MTKDEAIKETLNYFKENKVICKKVVNDGEGCHDFIAIFGCGKLTRAEIVESIKDNDIPCMFFEGAIKENERKSRTTVRQALEGEE